MLCETCMYDSDDGWCGLGSKLVEGECSGYVGGDKPIPPDYLPRELADAMTKGGRYLEGIRFPVWGYKVRLNPQRSLYDGVYTLLLLEGMAGYQALIENVDGQYNMQWGPCRLYIDSGQYRRVGVIEIQLVFKHLRRFPLYEQVDMGSYIWWLDPQVPAWSVDLFLQGLMAVRRMHDVFRGSGYFYTRYYELTPNLYYPYEHDPVEWLVPSKDVVLPPAHSKGRYDFFLEGWTTSRYWYHQGVFNYLITRYMNGTKDFSSMGRAHAEEYIRQWEVILHEYSTRLL